MTPAIIGIAQIEPEGDRYRVFFERATFACVTWTPDEASAGAFVRALNAELVEFEPARVAGGCGGLIARVLP